ncbi:MAG TPA: nucleotidyltransferase family protein [Allosphingosinicella sp.]
MPEALSDADERRNENLLLLASGLLGSGRERLCAAAERLIEGIDPLPSSVSPYLLQRAEQTRLVPALDHAAERMGLSGREPLQALSGVHAAAQRRLFEEAGAPLDALEARGIAPALIKGSDYVWSLYPRSRPRQMADVDLLVKPQFLASTIEAFTELGFRQGAFNRDTLVLTELTSTEFENFLKEHYEMPPFLKLVRCPELDAQRSIINSYCVPRDYILTCGEEVWLLIEIDVHYNLSFDLSLDVVWRGGREVQAWGRTRRGLAWETQIWFLAARLYVEATDQKQPVLRSLVDLAAILDAAPAIDWDWVIEVGELYGLFVAFHYVFEVLRQLDPALVPESVARRCLAEATAARNERVNRGALLPALLDSLETQRLA